LLLRADKPNIKGIKEKDMAKIFFPSCQNKIAYPNASKKLSEYLIASYGVEIIAGCCRSEYGKLSPEDTAIVICNTCFACCKNLSNVGNIISVWKIIDNDYKFPFPSYHSEKITVQDCWRTIGRSNVHNAVRSLLKKMDIEPIELDENRNKSRFCGGITAYMQQPVQNTDLAPRRYGTDTVRTFKEHSKEDIISFMKEHTKQFTTERVVSYCVTCDAGIKMGGKESVNLINLLFDEII
jgi:hypothetical protein